MKPPKIRAERQKRHAAHSCINEVSVFINCPTFIENSITYTFYPRQATHFHVLNLSVCLCIPCASPYMSAVAMPLSRDSFNQCTDFIGLGLMRSLLPTLTPYQHSARQLGHATPSTFSESAVPNRVFILVSSSNGK